MVKDGDTESESLIKILHLPIFCHPNLSELLIFHFKVRIITEPTS